MGRPGKSTLEKSPYRSGDGTNLPEFGEWSKKTKGLAMGGGGGKGEGGKGGTKKENGKKGGKKS